MSQVTLYVPCFNAARYLMITLPALLKLTYPVAEILIIDDGSTDDTADLASRYPVRVIRHGTNRGLGATRNTALSNCRTELIASIDADVEPEPRWLETLLAEFHDERIAGAGGELKEKHTHGLANGWRDAHMRQSWGDSRAVVEYLYGSNTVFRVEALREAGGYDERCRTNFEDVSVSRSVTARGMRLVYTPDARCWHHRQDTCLSIVRTYWGWQRTSHLRNPTLRHLLGSIRNHCRLGSRLLRQDLRRLHVGHSFIDISFTLYAAYRELIGFLDRPRSAPPLDADSIH